MLLLALACLSADPQGRFVNEYPAEVIELKREFAEARGTATVRWVKEGKLGLPRIFQFSTGPGRRKFEFENTVLMTPGKSSMYHYGYAELDGRNIEVQRTTPSQPYTVEAIGDDDPQRRANFEAIFGKYLDAPWGIGGRDIAEYIAGRYFTITEAREVEEQGKTLIEVTFRLTTMKEPHYFQAAFDPMLHWAIMRASKWTADPMKPSERFEVTYGPTASGRNYLKTLHWWDRQNKENLCEFGPVEFPQLLPRSSPWNTTR